MIYYLGKEKNLPFESCSKEDILEFCNNQMMLAVDTETTELHPQIGKLLLLQIGNEEHQFIIDCRTEDISFLKWALENVPIVLHNAKFDLRFLNSKGIYPYLNVNDTFIAEHIIMAGMNSQKNYAACCYKYFKLTISKDERNLFRKSIINEVTIRYGARDVEHLIPLFKEQLKIIKREKLQQCMELEFLYIPVMAYIEDCGMYIDQEKWKEKIELDTYRLNNSLDKLDEIYYTSSKAAQLSLFGNPDINWGSNPQVLAFLNSLGIYPYDKDNKPTTSSKVLLKMTKTHPIVQALLDFRKHSKNCSTYGETFIDLCNSFPDNRVRTSFRQILKTGRTGSGASESGESTAKEVNLQNIPRDKFTRSCFIPKEGYNYVVADYSQQEQNILANQSENPALLEFFRSGSSDMHCFVVRKMHPELSDLTDEQIKRDHAEKRTFAKSCGFASNYGGNGQTIAYNLGLSLEEGDRIYKSYVDSLPGLFDYFKLKEEETLSQKYILTNNVVKRRIYLPQVQELRTLSKSIDWEDYRMHKAQQSPHYFEHYKPLMSRMAKMKSSIRKAAMNSPIQSTGADMMKSAGIRFFHWILENGYINKVLIPNIIHDEYVAECPIEMTEMVKFKLEECMIEASVPFCDIVPMKLSVMSTHQWEH